MQYFHIISKEQPVGQVLEYFHAEFDKSGVKTYVPEDGHCAFIVDIDDKSYGFNPKDIDIERIYFTIDSKVGMIANMWMFLRQNKILKSATAAFDDNLLVDIVLANFKPILLGSRLFITYGIHSIELLSGWYASVPRFSLEFITGLTKKPFIPSPSKHYNFAKECQKYEAKLSVKGLLDVESTEHALLRAIVRGHQNAFEQLRTILKGEKVDPMLLLPCVEEELARMGIN